MSSFPFPKIIQQDLTALVDYCHVRAKKLHHKFNFTQFYHEFREHAGASTHTGQDVADLTFIQFLLVKVSEVKRKTAGNALVKKITQLNLYCTGWQILAWT